MVSLFRHDPERMRLKGDLEGLIKIAKTGKDPDIRRESIFALGRMQSPRAIQDLILLLTDPDESVQNAASDALEWYGKMAVIPLVETYETRSGDTVRMVHTVLIRIGEDSIPPLIDAASRFSPAGEERAAYTIYALGKRAVSHLIASLGSSDKKKADFSQAILETMGKTALPSLIEGLENQDEEIKARIAALLIILGDQIVLDLLSSCGNDTDETRTLKFYIISEIGTPSLEPLYQGLRDPNPVTSSMALKMFLEFGESAIVPLIKGLFDQNPDVKEVSENALIRIGAPVVPNLIGEIPLHTDRERDQILSLLVRIGEPAIPHMVASLFDPSVEISRSMITVLPRTGTLSVPFLMNIIGVHNDDTPIKQVFRELGRLAFPMLEEEIDREDGDRAIFALKMIRDIDPVRAVEPLISALYHRDRNVQTVAKDELIDSGDIAIPRIIYVLYSGNQGAADLAHEIIISEGDLAAPHLIDALTDPMGGDVEIVESIIKEIGEPTIPYLISVLIPGKAGFERVNAIMEEMGSSSITSLLEALPNAGSEQRPAIIHLLSEIYGTDPDRFIDKILSSDRLPEESVWEILNGYADSVLPHLLRIIHEGEEDEAKRAGNLLLRYKDQALPSLKEALINESDEDRSLLITTYLIQSGPDAIPYLIELLRNPSTTPYAVAALSSIGEPAIYPLIELLKDPDEQVVRYAGLTLTKIGKPAAIAIMPLLETEEAMIPLLSRILADMGGSALPDLLGELSELEGKGEGGSPRGIALMNLILEIALGNSEQMQILFSIPDKDLEKMLTNILVSRGETVIEPLIDSMLSWKTPIPDIVINTLSSFRKRALDRINHLLENLSDEDKRRIALIHLLGALGDPSSASVIFNSLKSQDHDIRIAAVKELGRFGRGAIEPLTQAMDDPDPEVRASAVESMGNIGLPVLDQLLIALKDKDGRIRAAAIAGIAKTGEPAQFMLVQALDDSDRRVRQDVVKLLTEMNWKPKYTTDRLSFLFAKENFDTLIRIGPPSLDILAKGLHDEDPEIRESSRIALEKIRTNLSE